MKIIDQNKKISSCILLFWISITIGILYQIFTLNFLIGQPVFSQLSIIACLILIFFLMRTSLKKLNLKYLIKFEDRRLIYNDYREKRPKIIGYKEIESIGYTYDKKYVEIRMKSKHKIEPKEKRILIDVDDVKNGADELIVYLRKVLENL